MKDCTILFVEDEPALTEIVKETLELRGFKVLHAPNVEKATSLKENAHIDIMVLDVMLPDGDGFSLLKKFRKGADQTPAIFLTSKSLPADVVAGFESGGNDYLKKPFSMEELIIRIKSLLGQVNLQNTGNQKSKETIQIGEYFFHYPEGILVHKGTQKKLTYREAEILNFFVHQHGQMIQRKELLLKYWENDDYFAGRSLDVFVTKLRKILKRRSFNSDFKLQGTGI